MRRLLSIAFTLLLMTAGAATAQTAAGEAGLGIQLLEAPADRRDDPRARLYVIDHLQPGSEISRRFAVVNNSAMPLSVRLYTGDADVSGGSFAPLDEPMPDGLGSWAAVSPDSAEIRPGERVEGTITLAVPADASDGERYGAVWAEVRSTSGALEQVNRVGLRLYVSVGEQGEPASDFTIDDLTASRDEAGNPVVQATVTNTGGRALDMSGSLRLTNGPGGLSAGPFPAELGTTLGIGQSQPVTVVLDKALPAGPWNARIDLRSGLLERAAEATITFPEAAGTTGPRVEAEPVPLAEDPNIVIPVAVGLLLLALLMLLFLVLKKRTKRQDDDEDDDPADLTALPAPRRSDEPVPSS